MSLLCLLFGFVVFRNELQSCNYQQSILRIVNQNRNKQNHQSDILVSSKYRRSNKPTKKINNFNSSSNIAYR